MQPIVLKTFKGCVPRLSAKLLPDGFAQTAENCDLRRGRLEAMKGLTSVVGTYGNVSGAGTAFSSSVKKVYKIDRDGTVTAHATWMADNSVNASFVRAQIANSGDRIYATGITGQSTPVQTDLVHYSNTTAPIWRALGVVAPTTELTTSMLGEPDYGLTEIVAFTNCAVTSGANTITIPSGQSHLGYQLEVGDIVTVSGTSSGSTDDDGEYTLEIWDGTGQILTINYAFTETQAASVSVTISRRLDAQVADSVSYVYTRVLKWMSGSTVISEEESAPSEATAVIDVYVGQAIELSGFSAGSYTESSTLALAYRIYRLASGSTGAEFQYLGEVDYTTGTEEFDDDSYATGCPHALLDVQADILETTDWECPPATLSGLTQYANGILAGFVGNKLYLSEPFVGYAWPSQYAMTFDYNIVALAVCNEALLVLTDGFPYVVTGLDPSSMTQQILPYEQACVSRQGVTVTNIGVIYPSPDGLFLLAGTSGKLLTKDVYTKDQWALLNPSNLISFYYDDQYIGFFSGTDTGIVFNFKENPYIIDLDIALSVTAGYLDPLDDKLYLVNGSALYSWGTNTTTLSYTWKSGIYRSGDSANYACGSIVADDGVTVAVYTDGSLKCTHIHWLDWDDETAYAIGDIVTHKGSQWICVTANTNQSAADTATPSGILTYDDAGVSGIPKLIRFGYPDNWYYVKVYPTASAEANGSGDDAADDLYLLTDAALTGTPVVLEIESGASTYYFKAYPTVASAVHEDGDISLRLSQYADAALSGEPRIAQAVVGGTEYHWKVYPTKAAGDTVAPPSVTTYWKAWTYEIDEMFRLQGGYRAREFEFQLSGDQVVDSISFGQTPSELL